LDERLEPTPKEKIELGHQQERNQDGTDDEYRAQGEISECHHNEHGEFQKSNQTGNDDVEDEIPDVQNRKLTHLRGALGDGVEFVEHLVLGRRSYQIGHAESASRNGFRE